LNYNLLVDSDKKVRLLRQNSHREVSAMSCLRKNHLKIFQESRARVGQNSKKFLLYYHAPFMAGRTEKQAHPGRAKVSRECFLF